MPRKSTSSTPGDADEAVSPQVQVQVPAQSHAQVVQATEQQLKARAEGGVSIEVRIPPVLPILNTQRRDKRPVSHGLRFPNHPHRTTSSRAR
jgi:hypothetical protein